MRALNYIINRIEFALKNSKPQKNGSLGTLHLDVKLLEALNEIIEFANGNKTNTQLEDSLLLCWIFSYWNLEIENQKPHLKENPKQYLKLTNAKNVMDKLCLLLKPKGEMIKELTSSLQIAQIAQGIPPQNLITEEAVKEMTDEILDVVKNDLKPISQLKEFWSVNYVYPPLTDDQRKMLYN